LIRREIDAASRKHSRSGVARDDEPAMTVGGNWITAPVLYGSARFNGLRGID
jgi:hypothetical protein